MLGGGSVMHVTVEVVGCWLEIVLRFDLCLLEAALFKAAVLISLSSLIVYVGWHCAL